MRLDNKNTGMYPNFAYFLNDYFNYPTNGLLSKIQTFGLFLSVCYIVTALLIFWEIRKVYDNFGSKINELILLVIILFGSSLIGSNIFHYIEGQELSSLTFNFLGSFTGCIICCYFYCIYKNLIFLQILDISSYPLLIGYAIGRLGCHLSGDGDWGIANIQFPPKYWLLPKWMWSYSYPHNILQKGQIIADCEGQYCRVLNIPVYPTSLYEFSICLILGLILYTINSKYSFRKGCIFSFFLILLGIERLLIEFIKVNPKYTIYSYTFSQAQIISLIMIVVGFFYVFFISYTTIKNLKNTAPKK